MFVQIRGSPWQMPNGQWMAQGHSNQLGKEVQMVAVICKPTDLVLPSSTNHNFQTAPWLALSLP